MAEKEAARTPWPRLHEAREKYSDREAFAPWVRAIEEAEGDFPQWLAEVVDKRCRGLSEFVAMGGFMLHYNRPFADLYMEVREDCRGRGFRSFLLQELKKECYLAGRVPAARCELQNTASRATLIKAGLKVCGFMLTGKIKTAC